MNGGGPAKQVAYLHKIFEQAGHECRLIYGQRDEGEVDFSSLLHDTKNVKVSHFLRRPISVLHDIAACLEIFFELLLIPYDVIHSHTAKAGLCSRLAAWCYRPVAYFLGRPKLRVVHTFHGHVFSGYFDQTMEQKVKRVEAWLWKLTDVPIALSEKLKSEIVEHLSVDGVKMQVVSLGLNLKPYLSPTEPLNYNATYRTEFKHWVGWVGRFVPIKNPEFFIEIAKELSQLRPDVGFVLFGEGLKKVELQTMIDQYQLQKRVKLAGWADDLSSVFAGLTILLNTSRNEGTPVAVIEAMAAGVPVYGTDVGGVKEVLQSVKGHKILSWDQHQSAVLIDQNLEQLEPVSFKEREEVVEKYSQQKLFENLKKLYRPVY
jgi:glycosyltransferase involved in cell wall biosynthesis